MYLKIKNKNRMEVEKYEIDNKRACLPARQGFTLVELLLVMAIIGILAGVIFMAISPARQRARLTNFKEQMNSINTAATLCVDGGGTITNGAKPGLGKICGTDSQTLPVIKTCNNGANMTNELAVEHPDSEDYAITLYCDNGASGDNDCRGVCNIDGCRFLDCNY